MKNLIAASIALLPLFAGAQAPKPAAQTPVPPSGSIQLPETKVTVAARGHDVRIVLSDMFAQAKKSFVVQPDIQFGLFLSLTDTPFDQALNIVCEQAGLNFDIHDGVYYIHKLRVEGSRPSKVFVRPVVVKPIAPLGKLPLSVLQRRVTTHMNKTDIRTVFAAFAEQTNLKIEVDAGIPDYKLDAFLVRTSLKYALDRVTQAADLTYRFTDRQTILIAPLESKVSLVKG
jgi:type II secretory pathway component GspD/PulD (secretin)